MVMSGPLTAGIDSASSPLLARTPRKTIKARGFVVSDLVVWKARLPRCLVATSTDNLT